MEVPRDAQTFARFRATLSGSSSPDSRPDLDSAGSRAVEAWFLGPKAENATEFERLIVEAIRDHAYWRRNYHPSDPTHITQQIKRSPDYLQASDALEQGFQGLLAWLKKSVPFFSMRYQGHMNWDLTLPGMLGYFAAMLYNPNNVAFEGSTSTTFLELLVGDDLCQMLGYRIPPSTVRDAVRPWGHITCDGSVANIEALWAARNLRYYPAAVHKAISTDARMAAGLALEVRLSDGSTCRLIDLDPWQLLNLASDEALKLPASCYQLGISTSDFNDAVGDLSLQTLGVSKFNRDCLGGFSGDPVVLVSGTKHYSWPKATALLGLGSASLINLMVDLDARMDIADLRNRLDGCLKERRPVISVVVVIGTTEESSIDPLFEVIALKREYAKKGLAFHVHADAAWGGYHRSVINPDDFDLPQPGLAAGLTSDATPIAVPLSAYAQKQLAALPLADSITVDPHKSGYIPYPAGALCYRNGSMRHLVSFSAPVVFHGTAEPTIGIYGVEGSKPGAAAAAVYLSHRVIRPNRNGYGKIIGEALFSCRKLYARLLTMAKPTDSFIIVPVPRQPAERVGKNALEVAAERDLVRDLIDRQSNIDIRSSAPAMALLGEIGPDQNILSYAFNLRLDDGTINTDLQTANALNKALYKILSVAPESDIYGYDLIVSTTDFDESAYGPAFIRAFKARLGIASDDTGKVVTVLRSVVMDPWVTETDGKNFIDVLEKEFRKAASLAVEQVRRTSLRGY